MSSRGVCLSILLSVTFVHCIKTSNRSFNFCSSSRSHHSSFCRAMPCIKLMHGLCCHPVSVRLSVTFVDHVKTNKHIFEFFSPSGSDTILVFPSQSWCRYSDGNPPNGGVECKGYDKMIFHKYLAVSQKR